MAHTPNRTATRKPIHPRDELADRVVQVQLAAGAARPGGNVPATIVALVEVRRAAGRALDAALIAARAAGLTWESIGNMLGVTPQAAQQAHYRLVAINAR